MQEQETQQLPPMQLHMSIAAAKALELPEIVLDEGYALRGYVSGGEEGLLDLMHTVGFFRDEGLERMEAYLAEPERREGTRVAVFGGDVVAVAFASRHSLDPKVGGLDFVACHPEHRGKGLGRAVCAAVLKYLVDRGYGRITLSTDDWRLPAIKVYLSLGFSPEMCREDMPGRWEAVRKKLGPE